MVPPGITAVFFTGNPPNATNSAVWSTMTSQVVVSARASNRAAPTICGKITSDAPAL
ncbi:Uncharacterised protein [Mycobacterium tuberculosis]|uniref:Uncharacterized protein n=1 Tax=Mycobacterium tuberculosis TaxID=1773 RepID=A0A654TU79_MYCTX|nr:Uncharacterised protein [Mycobacterium tuberculosis]CFE82807.1 Uncharacterised protein [Mycobacterium tuberculosis]CKQ62352.1 Uncharacterised protein [Mycobacterium tuberculosis]CKT57103.1 Uncharacterised protein [Mycobacterium tuberculosis]CKT81216.1 Uncharacterised protein [Mycobacterium tuberculosis]